MNKQEKIEYPCKDCDEDYCSGCLQIQNYYRQLTQKQLDEPKEPEQCEWFEAYFEYGDEHRFCRCDNCKVQHEELLSRWKFCPNCGAKIKRT